MVRRSESDGRKEKQLRSKREKEKGHYEKVIMANQENVAVVNHLKKPDWQKKK